MRIVFDLQSCQSHGNRHRGIGRYVMALTKAIIEAAPEDDVWLALNGEIGDSVEYVRAAFDGLLPQERIVAWKATPNTALVHPANRWRHEAALNTREALLESLQPDLVHLSNLFDGYHEDIVVSVPRRAPYATSATLYDLIPLIYADAYLAEPAVRAWYMQMLEHLQRADRLLAISDDVCNDARRLLGVPDARLVNVRAASDAMFRPLAISGSEAAALRARFRIQGRFLLYTGGIDYRKNVEGLIHAYARLPAQLRRELQLLIVCAAHPLEIARLRGVCAQANLAEREVVFTGYVSDADLLVLYNLCHAFVFPSWHEGFGLPALEAMACGAATIGSATSSIPEVIGRKDALFNPRNLDEMAALMRRVLTDEPFRQNLCRYGPRQATKFSWQESARRALAAMRETLALRRKRPAPAPHTARKRTLAFATPLPPVRSGVADYSARLLPALAAHYRIEVISDQPEFSDPWLRKHIPLRSTTWFEQHAEDYDRVLYHIGNGELHKHLPAVLERHPGVVVLSEVYLSGITSNLEWCGDTPGYFTRCLYQSHGYHALRDREASGDREFEREAVLEKYPASLPVIQDAEGVIVHSQFTRDLADHWYGSGTSRDWTVAPLPRVPPARIVRKVARQRLGVGADDLLVCCFGVIGPHKCNLELLKAWRASKLAEDPRAQLVLVGGGYNPHYDAQLQRAIGADGRIRVTGWAERAQYEDYLAAADIAVQLRRCSCGEASGSVLDCLACGLPTIVNAHGSFAQLPRDVVLMIPDAFDGKDLASALERLARDPALRDSLRQPARRYCKREFDPERIATQYRDAIEAAHRQGPRRRLARLVQDIAQIDVGVSPSADDVTRLAAGIAANQRPRTGMRQLLVDISELVRRDAKSGIQRVVRSVLAQLLEAPPPGYRVEPVYAEPGQRYRYARAFTAKFLGLSQQMPPDEPIDTDPGDVFLGLDLAAHEIVGNAAQLEDMRNRGTRVFIVVYDVLPLVRADCFPGDAYGVFDAWVATFAKVADGAICISRAVEDDLRRHLDGLQIPRQRPFKLGHFHLGADIDASLPSAGIAPDEQACLEQLHERPSFLVVGTIEPRKGQAQALDAFERLWVDGDPAALVLVGKPGWMTETLVARLRNHVENGKRLFWFATASDELLTRLYAQCSALLAPSEGEGFGLPLIEAAQHGLPILCRDLPVFREVAGAHASYFSGHDAASLAKAIRDWLVLRQRRAAPPSRTMPWLTWQQSTQQLLDVALHGRWDGQWLPNQRFWFAAYDARMTMPAGRRERGCAVSTGAAGVIAQTWPCALAGGRHRLQVRGKWLAASGGARCQVLAPAQTAAVADIGFSAAQAPCDGLLLDCFIELAQDFSEIEIRISASADARLAIEGCIVTPTPAADGEATHIAAASVAPARDRIAAVAQASTTQGGL